MTNEDPWGAGAEQDTFTIKFGKGFEAPWLVLHGTAEQMVERATNFFSLDRDECDNLTPAEILLKAVHIAQGQFSVTDGLGGTPLSKKASKPVSAAPAAPEQGSSAPPWKQDEVKADEVSPEDGLVGQLQAASTKKDVQSLYVGNKELFKSSTKVQEAFKARMGEVA